MKFLFSALILTIGLFLLSSCNRPDVKLPSKEGKWNYTWTLSDSSGGTIGTNTGIMTFTKDGSGTMTIEPSTQSSPFTWSYDKSGKKITWKSGASEAVFDVEEAKAKSEKWHMTTISPAGSLDVTLTR